MTERGCGTEGFVREDPNRRSDRPLAQPPVSQNVRSVGPPKVPPNACSGLRVDDAEVVAFGVSHPGVGCEPFLDGRTKLYEPQDLARSVVGSQVEVQGPLREAV